MATFARLLVLPAALALMLGLFAFVAPAQADATLTLSADSTSVPAGTDVQLTWDSTDATTVDATGDWTTNGAKALDGTESVPTSTPGTLTFTLTADDDDAATPAASQTVEVTVTEADDSNQTTPEAPAVEGCNFTIPDIEGLTYSVSLDVETIPLEPDTYPQLVFSDDDDIVTIVATADDGFEIADGATDTFTIEVAEGCFDLGFENADLVDAAPTCQAITFTNTADVTLQILYGDPDADEPTGEFSLEAGQSRRVKSLDRTTAYFAYDAALGDPDDLEESDPSDVIEFLISTEFGDVTVPQNCGSTADHPTVAPAAGA